MDSFGNIRPLSEHTNVYTASSPGGFITDTWLKPNEATMVFMMAIGPGAGGYSGALANSSDIQGGLSSPGGGGGSCSLTLIPACLLPSSLGLSVGYGGIGGVAQTGDSLGNSGTGGFVTYITCWPTTGKSTNTVQSNFLLANKGQNAASYGATANGGSAVTITSCYLSAPGIFKTTAGGSSTNGGENDQPSNNPYGATVTCGGSFGGGATSGTTSYAGANTTASTGDPILIFGYGATLVLGGGATAGGDNLGANSTYYAGVNGITAGNNPGTFPLRWCGGSGGSSAFGTGASTAIGGNGSIGAGGGGGGVNANLAATASGVGGNGGNGLIMITWW